MCFVKWQFGECFCGFICVTQFLNNTERRAVSLRQLSFIQCSDATNAAETRRHSIPSSIPRWRLVMPPSECRWIAVLVCKINLLTLCPWPLTFELQNSITSRLSQGHSLYQVWTLLDHSFLSYAPNKQTNRQTDGLKHSTHDIVGVSNSYTQSIADFHP